MSDEWTWEDRQDTLDYRQWKAEQDAERGTSWFLRVQELEAENNILRSLLEEHGPNWSEAQKAALLEAVNDYIDIYACVPKLAERVEAAREVIAIAQEIAPARENVASLKTELAAALTDIIMYRRMRYADSHMEEARYRELTGKPFDEE